MLLFVSATKIWLLELIATPHGEENDAKVPVALLDPAVPVPAKVVTTPADVI
jgi:hypothetical protein